MQTAFSVSTEEVLVHLLLQLAVIVLWARGMGALFQRVGQSRSMGEILGGVLLGPSLVGWVLPGPWTWLFESEGANLLPYFSHMGLVLALFLIGMEFDVRDVRPHLGKVVGLALASLIVPVAAGAAISSWLWTIAPGERGWLPYALFVGMVLAITAIPIMGRVLIEQGLTTSRVGVLAITTGAVKDLFTWFLLAIVSGISRPPVDLVRVALMIGLTALLGVFVLTVGRRGVTALVSRFGYVAGKPHPDLLAGLLAGLFLLAAATSELGIFAIFGAFLAGLVVGLDRELARSVEDRIHDLTVTLFLPIFFTYTGLRVDLTDLGGTLLLALVVVTVVGFLATGGTSALLARRSGMSGPESLAMGALIATPGLMILILLNVGLDLGVIPKALFSVLVAHAMLRNIACTPVLRWAKAQGLPPIGAT